LAVNRDARNLFGKSGGEPAGAGNTASLWSDRVDVAKNDIVNGIGVDARALHEGFDAVSTNICGVDL
jgi:hypothetical protein